MNRWILTLFVALSFGWAAPAWAQDWNVESDEKRQQEIVKRYKTLLERNPTEGLALTKLLDYVGKGKRLERLVNEYARRVEKKPDNVNLRLILGHLYKATNEYDKALEQYNAAVELDSDSPLALMSRGSVYVLLQKNEEATADFEGALAVERDKQRKEDILRKLADTAFAQRDWERAQKYYDQLVSLDPRNEYLRLEYAQVLVQYKRYDRALEEYEALLKLVGRDTKAKATTLRDIGDLYEKMGKDDEAIATYKKAMKLMRSGNWLHRELRQRIVSVYRRADRLEELVTEYSKSWRNPNYDQAMLLGTLYDELGREDDALASYKQAIRRNRRASEPRLRVIRIMERRGQDKAVIKAYNELIAVTPGEARYYFDLVRIHFRLGDRKQAKKLLNRIASRFARDPEVHVMLADTYMRFDMGDEALATYRKLVRMDPRNDAYILGLGEYYYQNGEVDDAITTWNKLLKSSLTEEEAHAKLGQVLAEHGLVEKGLQHYEQAVNIAPDDINVRRGLALAYERARRWTQAVDSWKQILQKTDQPLLKNEARSRVIAIYQRQNKLNSKLREFAGAFETDPNDYQAGFFLAEAYVKLVMYDKAEATLARIVERARTAKSVEHETSALLALEKLHQQNNDLDKAIAALQRLAELMPLRARDYYHRIADLSLKLYQDDQAVHYATLAVQGNPDDAMAQARLGDVYRRMGNLESAAAQYRQAIDLDPRAFEISMMLADILMELGQIGEAESLYRVVTKKANDESLILKAARRAFSVAEVGGRLQEVEDDFYNLVYVTPPKPVYRKLMLELYDRLSDLHVARDRYGVPSERAAAAQELDAIGSRAMPILIDALNADELGQRALAVRLLGDLRQPNAALPLSRLVDDVSDPLRLAATVSVAQIGDPRASAALIRVTEDSNPAMRELAIWALGAIGGDSAVKRLVQILTAGQSFREQLMAAMSLGRIGSPAAVAALVDYYDGLATARYADATLVAVTWALGRARDPSAVNVLVDALDRGPDRAAAVAAWSLARIGNRDAVLALVRAHWGDNAQARVRATRGLMQVATMADTSQQRRVDEIRREIRHIDTRNPSVKVEEMLRELENATAVVVPADVTQFVQKHREVFIEVARARLQDESGQHIVTDALLAVDGTLALGALTSAPVRTSAERTQRDEAVRGVVSGLRAELREVARTASEAGLRAIGILGALGDAGDIELVLARAGKSGNGQRHAVAALGGYPASKVQAPLTKAAASEDYRVRVAAMTALGRVLAAGGDRTTGLKTLRTGMGDRYPTVRIAAAQALAASGAPGAAAILVSALDDPHDAVILSAIEGLRDLDTAEARAALEPFQRSDDIRFRRAAAPSEFH